MSHFIAGLAIEQYPAQLDHLGRVFRHVHAMFIASCCYMYNHITVELGSSRGCAGHVFGRCRCRTPDADPAGRARELWEEMEEIASTAEQVSRGGGLDGSLERITNRYNHQLQTFQPRKYQQKRGPAIHRNKGFATTMLQQVAKKGRERSG